MYAQIQSAHAVELTGGTITFGDVQFSYETMLLWSDAERKARDIYKITEAAIPSGKVATGSSLQYSNGVVSRTWTLVDAPAPKLTTFKTDIWRRCVGNEAALLDGALDTAPATLRRLFDAAQMIEHDAPEFPVLRDAIANTVTDTTGAIIGYTRADELLAPSTPG